MSSLQFALIQLLRLFSQDCSRADCYEAHHHRLSKFRRFLAASAGQILIFHATYRYNYFSVPLITGRV